MMSYTSNRTCYYVLSLTKWSSQQLIQFMTDSTAYSANLDLPKILPSAVCNSPVINLFLTTGGLHSKPTKFTKFTHVNSYKFAFDPGNVRCIYYDSQHRTSPTSLTSSQPSGFTPGFPTRFSGLSQTRVTGWPYRRFTSYAFWTWRSTPQSPNTQRVSIISLVYFSKISWW